MYCLLKEALTSLEEQLISHETLAHLFIITKHACRDRRTHRHVDGLLVGRYTNWRRTAVYGESSIQVLNPFNKSRSNRVVLPKEVLDTDK